MNHTKNKCAVTIKIIITGKKQSHDRPWGFQEVEATRFQDSRKYEGGKVVSPTHRPPLPLSKHSWYSFLLEAESTPGP